MIAETSGLCVWCAGTGPTPAHFLSQLQTWGSEIMLDLAFIEHLLRARIQ